MSVRNKFDTDEVLKETFNFAMLKRSFIYIKGEKHLFYKAITFQLIAILCGLCGPFITATAIDKAIPRGDMEFLLRLSGFSLLTIATNIFFSSKSNKITHEIGQNIVLKIRRDLYSHLQELSFSYYDSRPHGKILIRVINYVNSVSTLLSNGLINMILQLFNLFFIAIFMFTLDSAMALVVLSGLPAIFLFLISIKPMQRKGWQEYSTKSSNLNAFLSESINCMRITKLFTRESYNTNIFQGLLTDTRKAWYKAVYATSAVSPIIDFISRSVTALLILYGLFWANPMVSFGVLLAMIQYSNRFWQPINQLANIYNNFINNIAYIERIFETIDEPVLVSDVENAKNMPIIKGNVSFQNVYFAYDPEQMVLKGIDFSIKSGESVALVGHTGSGKTTIINLLSRFYNCTEGKF